MPTGQPISSAARAQALAQLEAAVVAGQLSASTAANVRPWLGEPWLAEFSLMVAQHIAEQKWAELQDAFWTTVPFGTAGRRGKMYPIGTNAINDRTIGETAQGLVDYVERDGKADAPPRCAVAYDTRHRSRHFAQLCAEVLATAGWEVLFLDGHRPTPELAFTVRHHRCACGLMISASHNPPSDNAAKVFWSTGGQVRAPHDQGIMECIAQVREIRRLPFDQAVVQGRVTFCQQEMDRLYQQQVLAQGFPGPRDLKVLYSPLHGVGTTSVPPVLAADGFADVEVFGPHAAPDGDFPNVPDHVANPENPAVFEAPIQHATRTGADLIVATDPDADRLGCAARLLPGGDWRTFNGNQIAVLLAEYLLRRRQQAGTLSADHYLIKTLVTTDMLRRVADGFGIQTHGDVLTGFKWIGSVIDEQSPERFVMAAEEAHGYLAGAYIRDKDGAVASLLLSELAAELKAQGQTLHQHLRSLYAQYGYHLEQTTSHTMPGADGMVAMARIMTELRDSPPATLGGLAVRQMRDYQRQTVTTLRGPMTPLRGPRGDVLFFDTELTGNYAAVRPSGTEPKIKCYFFGYEPPANFVDVAAAEQRVHDRLAALQIDLLSRVRG